MGSNALGQLGINEPYLDQKYSPVLVDALLNQKPTQVAAGDFHTLVQTQLGDVFAWGNNECGQCGTGPLPVLYEPSTVNFDQYYRPNIKQVSAGGNHSSFVDDIGRLFMVGKSDHGQLGLGSTSNEIMPVYITHIPDKIAEAACGAEHTLVLTQKGEVYAMGAN